jgi:biotin carboxylase
MEKKTRSFIIVGGSQSHVPFINAANELGFKVTVFDRDFECVGRKHCDNFYQISTRDQKQIVAKCIEIDRVCELSGIMTYSASNDSLMAVSSACSILGLPCFSTDCISKIVNKNIMKGCFSKHGVPSTEWIMTEDTGDAVNFFRKVGKVVLKPSLDGRGSKGVVLCDTESSVLNQFLHAKGASKNLEVVAEKYYDGSEYSVDGIVIDDTPIVLSIAKKNNLGKNFNFIMSGFLVDFPFKNEKERCALEKAGIESVVSLGISNSFFSVDILMSKSKAIVLECGVLLDCKIDRLLYFAGIDVYSLFVRMATKLPLTIPSLNNRPSVALSFLFSNEEGILIRKNKLETKNAVLEWERNEGDVIHPPKSIADTLGWVISNGADASVAYNYAQKINQTKLYGLEI